jgi:hypothetical protein
MIMMEIKLVKVLKYIPSEIFDNFWFIISYGDQNIR